MRNRGALLAIVLGMNIQTYLTLTNNNSAHPTANEPCDGDTLYRFSCGTYGATTVEVFADSDEGAFEVAVEWLDDNAPECLVSHEEFQELVSELAAAHPALNPDEGADWARMAEMAEEGLTIISHTALKTGMHIASDSWTVTVVGSEP